uniref:Retrovirus-related Pol polyprotein from transposon TNT 1-94-like beta-barrel domain-containing protein n=1 Tax=Peronospora matthiolae TaxID=2874970 RepID=A0AAV1U1I9_9STRA
MTRSKKFMRNYKGFDAVDVHLADDGIVQAIGSGDIVMSMKTPQGMKKGVLTNVWHIPSYPETCSRSAASPRMSAR